MTTTSEATARRGPRLWPAAVAGRRSWHVAVPGALTGYLAFASGGFFPGQVAVGAAALALVLLLRLTVAHRPLEGWSAGAAAVAVLATLLAVWTLVSAAWADAPARALFEFDRTLLYLLAFAVMACFAAAAVRPRGGAPVGPRRDRRRRRGGARHPAAARRLRGGSLGASLPGSRTR